MDQKEKIYAEKSGLYLITSTTLTLWENTHKQEFPISEVTYNVNRNTITKESFYRFSARKDRHHINIPIHSLEKDFFQILKKAQNDYKQMRILTTIKDLLSELKANDEVPIDRVIEVIKQELRKENGKPLVLLDDMHDVPAIKRILQAISDYVKGFKFVRLKDSIRCDSDMDMTNTLSKMDELFKEWEGKSLDHIGKID